ncbi:uncharacterized protein LOC112341438 [Selaginella moellendorffii]|uniref:uncharacterized protein LOC112341438 n=1 Tax=Selaginella moellendorffii TaxID=88036 RepID=UPI000D1C2A95|nr:uncharacterized protein LOC112341438 [Selaginella moellendorffii]|eukprot:XP_024517292.1 uncharacterized protein LOC112341438 [Selaginella moellendorffii]
MLLASGAGWECVKGDRVFLPPAGSGNSRHFFFQISNPDLVVDNDGIALCPGIRVPRKWLKKKKELRVLIVGASGFLGSQLALGLAAHNHRNLRFVVTGLDLVRSERTLLLENKGIEVIIGSATYPKLAMAVTKSKKPNIVVDFTQQEHSWNLEDNERTIKSLIDAACSIPSTQGFFFASPNRFYIPSSRSGEKLVESLAPELPFPIVEWRFSTVYGRYGRPDFPYYKFVDQIVHGALVPLWKQRKGRQNYIYINDAVTVMINSILSTHSIGKVNLFDIGTPWRPIPFRRVIQVIARLTNKEAKVEEAMNFNPPPWEVPYEPPTKLLLLKSYTPFETGMSSFIEWFQQNKMVVGVKDVV